MADSKKVALVIASENFREEEYEKPKEILEGRGVEVKTISSQPGERKGTMGKTATVDMILDDLNMQDFDGIVFIGGAGAVEYFDSPTALNLVKEAVKAGKVIAAICIAPSILANAGALQGKNATAFPSEENNLKQKGTNYTEESVVVDGRIITAIGPEAAQKFGEEIADILGV